MANKSVIFTRSSKRAFSQHLLENPNKRRVSQRDKENIIEWLTKPDKQPSSQKEFSRRNYVQNVFTWDEKSQTLKHKSKKSQTLPAAIKKGKGLGRKVVTTDMIADVIKDVHINGGHGGWDATWEGVSSIYYGILRSDVNFLVKRCQECAGKPSKRPKGSAATIPTSNRPTRHQRCCTRERQAQR